jgi:hypothetical protein
VQSFSPWSSPANHRWEKTMGGVLLPMLCCRDFPCCLSMFLKERGRAHCIEGFLSGVVLQVMRCSLGHGDLQLERLCSGESFDCCCFKGFCI